MTRGVSFSAFSGFETGLLAPLLVREETRGRSDARAELAVGGLAAGAEEEKRDSYASFAAAALAGDTVAMPEAPKVAEAPPPPPELPPQLTGRGEMPGDEEMQRDGEICRETRGGEG